MLDGKRIACALFALTPAGGCVTMDGPCRIEARADGSRAIECEEGGSTVILAPSRVIEATGAAAASAAARPQGAKHAD